MLFTCRFKRNFVLPHVCIGIVFLPRTLSSSINEPMMSGNFHQRRANFWPPSPPPPLIVFSPVCLCVDSWHVCQEIRLGTHSCPWQNLYFLTVWIRVQEYILTNIIGTSLLRRHLIIYLGSLHATKFARESKGDACLPSAYIERP